MLEQSSHRLEHGHEVLLALGGHMGVAFGAQAGDLLLPADLGASTLGVLPGQGFLLPNEARLTITERIFM